MTRREITRLGRKRADYVRVVLDGTGADTKVRVLWREGGHRRLESFEHTRRGIAEAKAFAEGRYESLRAARTPVAPSVATIRLLWERYAETKRGAMRPATWVTAANRWRKFELFLGRDYDPAKVTLDTMDAFHRALHKAAHAPNQIRQYLALVRQVFRWGVARDAIASSKVTAYAPEFSRDAAHEGPKMAEYRPEAAAAILSALHPRSPTGWRPYVLATILRYTGARQRAARHLEWRDVDFALARVTWRPELDKMATEREQPLPRPVVEALWVAYGWRCATGYTGPFILFGAQARTRDAKPWTYSAFNEALRRAETAAGVPHIKYRAAHGFRRGVSGDVLKATGGNLRDAANWIGDQSMDVVRKHYDKDRVEEQVRTADLLTKLGEEKKE